MSNRLKTFKFIEEEKKNTNLINIYFIDILGNGDESSIDRQKTNAYLFY
jgi:hypothetical protein